MKIYIVKFESCVDGEYLFSATPCATLEIAKSVLKKEKEFILNESAHFSNLTEDEMEDMEIEGNEESFYINDLWNDYYEYYTIEESDLRESIEESDLIE